MWPSMFTTEVMLGWQFGTATKKPVTAMLLPSSTWQCRRWNSAGLLVGWWSGCARVATTSTPLGCWPTWCRTWLSPRLAPHTKGVRSWRLLNCIRSLMRCLSCIVLMRQGITRIRPLGWWSTQRGISRAQRTNVWLRTTCGR